MASFDITFSSLKETINEIEYASIINDLENATSNNEIENALDDDSSSINTEDIESYNSENSDVDMDDCDSETDLSCDEYSEYSDTEDNESATDNLSDDYEMDDADSQDDNEDKAIEEIKYYQRTVHNLIPYENFSLLVKEIAQDYATDINFTNNAFLALQCASEDYLVTLFRQSQKCAIHGGRVAIQPKDFKLAQYLNNND
jgi:histone H3/H4